MEIGQKQRDKKKTVRQTKREGKKTFSMCDTRKSCPSGEKRKEK